ncbi:MAG: hypothetical protein M3Q95_07190 [Bacteroidota bacterium]|nr:hypothetical protein [Bacteroidota bacterium]
MKNFIASIIIILAGSTFSVAQTRDIFRTNLCQRWQLNALEIKESGKKISPDKKMQQNFLEFDPDGTFRSLEDGVMINGKWKADEIKMEIVNTDFDNQNITSPLIFTIIALTNTHLAITTNPNAEKVIIMHYVVGGMKSKPSR